MGIDTSGVVLFVHIALVVVGMMLAALVHLALIELAHARNTTTMRPWAAVIKAVEPALPLVALAILGSGAWLLHLSGGEFKWTDGWVYVSLAGLIAAEAVGAILSPTGRALRMAITSSTDGPVPEALRRLAHSWRLWVGAHFASAEFFGIIFLMSAKPSSTWACVVVLVVAGVLGVLTALPFTSRHGLVDSRAGSAP